MPPASDRIERERSGTQSAAMPSPFPPIADYAFLSNCHTGALVALDGSIDWLCVPRFDSPSVFGTLLDRQAGTFRIGPFSINHPIARVYEPGTNTVSTTWRTLTGWAVVRDALTMAPREGEDVITPHTRPPADDDAAHMLVRTVRCLEGTVQIDLVCEPVFDYGREPAVWTLTEGSRQSADASGAGQVLAAAHRHGIGHRGRVESAARHELQAGDEVFCALSWAEGLAAPVDAKDANARIDVTNRFWHNWLSRARIPDHAWAHPIQRSALAIKGMTYMPTGATIAALTTSLPETPGGERNWDYRYTWMRDATFTLQALHFLNLDWEADEFMQFVADLEPNSDGALQIMYGIDGRRDLTEETLDHLSGLRRCAVRCGSATARSTNGRTTCTGPCSTRSFSTPGGTNDFRGGCGPSSAPRRSARRSVWRRARPGDLGGARRPAALRVVQADVLGRPRPGGEARAHPRRRRARRRVARDRRRDTRRDPRARGE